jgi:hypothetical protein
MAVLELEQRLQAIAGQVRQLEVSLQRHDDCQRWSNRSKRSASMSHRVWQQIRFCHLRLDY